MLHTVASGPAMDTLRAVGVVTVQMGDNQSKFQFWLGASVQAASTIAAFWAVLIAARVSADDRQARDGDRVRSLYDRIVLDVCLVGIQQFVQEQATKLDASQSDIEKLNYDLLTHAAVLDKAKVAADSFNEAFYQLRAMIRGALVAWGDDRLSAAVNFGLQDLQDVIVDGIRALAANRPAGVLVSATLVERIGPVVRTIASYEPTKKVGGRPASARPSK